MEVNNKHLIVASCWFFSLHTLLTMHGHRNQKTDSFCCKICTYSGKLNTIWTLVFVVRSKIYICANCNMDGIYLLTYSMVQSPS